jgi:flagellar biosynthetic protein FliQ
MAPEGVSTLAREAFQVMLMISAPMLLVILVVGLIVSLFQAATQINEMTLSFIPKLVGLVASLLLAGPWMLSVMTDYLRQILMRLPSLIG